MRNSSLYLTLYQVLLKALKLHFNQFATYSIECIKYSHKFIDKCHFSKSELWKDGIHLLKSGKSITGNNFINSVNSFLGYMNSPIRNLKKKKWRSRS